MCQPLKTFFKISCDKSEKYLGEAVQNGNVAVRIETKYKQEKTQMPIDELIAEINKNGNYKSYHEVTTNQVNKMYFDIEHETYRISHWKIVELVQQVIQNNQARVFIADGCKSTKMSYHIVVEILTSKEVNKHIAKLLNAKIGKHPDSTGKLKWVVDTAVYSQNHTMRLPNCVKISERQIENRKLKML